MRVVALLSACALLAACQPDPASPEPGRVVEEEPAPPPGTPVAPPTPAPAPPLEPVATLVGEWRVAGIDGAPPDAEHGLALSADAREIWWEPRCAGMILGYTIDGLAIETGPRVSEPPASTSTPAPVCLIGQPAELPAISRALQTATRVGRTAENGVLIEGGGHSLLLFSQ